MNRSLTIKNYNRKNFSIFPIRSEFVFFGNSTFNTKTIHVGINITNILIIILIFFQLKRNYLAIPSHRLSKLRSILNNILRNHIVGFTFLRPSLILHWIANKRTIIVAYFKELYNNVDVLFYWIRKLKFYYSVNFSFALYFRYLGWQNKERLFECSIRQYNFFGLFFKIIFSDLTDECLHFPIF